MTGVLFAVSSGGGGGGGYSSPTNWWKFNDGSGTTVVDSVGGQNASLLFGPTWVSHIAPLSTSAAALPGGDYATTSVTFPLASDGTWIAWVNFTSSVSGYLFGSVSGNNRFYLGFDSGSWSIAWSAAGETGTFSASGLSAGTTYMLAYVKSSNVVNVYVNGSSTPSWTYTFSSTTGTSAAVQMCGYGGTNIVGTVDDFRYYNSAISTAQIAAIYAGTN